MFTLKNRLLPLVILALATPIQIFGQEFVSPSNKWFVDECSYCPHQMMIICDTKSYWFEGAVTIDSTVYYELQTTDSNPTFEVGTLYREEDGVVFMKLHENTEEFAIYDFKLEVGALFTVNDFSHSVEMEVLSIDSVVLNSGEKRKRLEIARALNHNFATYWIEGVGSELSPMNSIHTFSLDIWLELNCYHRDEVVEWQLGDCMLTNTKAEGIPEEAIACYPNPATDELHLSTTGNQPIDRVAIIGLDGRSVLEAGRQELQPISLSGLSQGLYVVTVVFENGAVGRTKFVKQ